jgi:hypothetical protein
MAENAQQKTELSVVKPQPDEKSKAAAKPEAPISVITVWGASGVGKTSLASPRRISPRSCSIPRKAPSPIKSPASKISSARSASLGWVPMASRNGLAA